MSIHEQQLCTPLAEKIYRGVCQREGCDNTWESPTTHRKFCKTPECDKARQQADWQKNKKPRNGARRPKPKLDTTLNNKFLSMRF